MGRKNFLIALLIFVLILLESKLLCAELDISIVFDEAKKNLKRIDFILTNMGYSTGANVDADLFYDTARKHSISVKNIHYIHSSENRPLFFAFFESDSKDLFYVDSTGKKVKENIGFGKVVANSHEWDRKIRDKIFSGFEFSILTFTHMISSGAPYEIMKAGEFHNHICPGLWVGYLISQFIKREMKPGEDLIVFAIPPFCKDDFFQVRFDATAGKRSIYVREMRDEERKLYPDLAGIYVFLDRNKEPKRALMLGFDIKGIKREAKIDENEYPWLWRYRLNDWIVKNVRICEKSVRVIKEVSVDKEKVEKLKRGELSLKDL
jgi:formylmethanofuran dehydrogenase subunit E-like metal-binding protein